MSEQRNTGNKKDNRKDSGWKYCIEVEGPGKGYKYVKCNFCKKVITAGVSRLKEHLAGTHRDSKPCEMVTVDVRKEMKEYLKKLDEAKSFKEREFDEMVGGGSYFNNHASIGKGGSSKGSSSSRGVRGPMDHYVNNIIIDEDDAIQTEDKGNQMKGMHLLDEEDEWEDVESEEEDDRALRYADDFNDDHLSEEEEENKGHDELFKPLDTNDSLLQD